MRAPRYRSLRRATAPAAVAVAGLCALMALSTVVVPQATATSTAGPRAAVLVTARSTHPANPDQPPVPRRCLNYADAIIMNAVAKCDLLRHRPGAPTIVLWGDSHAWQQISAVEAAIGHRRVNLVAFIMGGCPLLDRRASPGTASYSECDAMGHLALTYLQRAAARHRDVHVVVAMAWELYHDVVAHPDDPSTPYPQVRTPWIISNAKKGRSGTLRAFKALGRLRLPTDVVGQMPIVYTTASCPQGDDPFRCDLPRRAALKNEHANSDDIARMMRQLKATHRLVNPSASMCDHSVCRARAHGVPTYFDDYHIGARMAATYGERYFGPTVRATLAAQR